MSSLEVLCVQRFLRLILVLGSQTRKHLAYVMRVILCSGLQGRGLHMYLFL